MDIKFDPNNAIIKLCMSGMGLEDSGNIEDAITMFHKAWYEATDDYERFIAAYHIARLQKSIKEKIKWMETSLQCAQKINEVSVKSAYPTLYLNVAKCYEELGDSENAKRNYELSNSAKGTPSDVGPFYHGTKADLKVGDLLTAGGISNYKPGLTMNHIYFTANVNGAGIAAALAKGEGRERIYIIEPTGEFENDPNVTDKKFPGNLTRSYRTKEPLRIIGEETEWTKLTTTEQRNWREKTTKNKGEIIN
ncbi:DNA/RNA tunnel of bacterial DNA dependent RNA polymerase [Syntrophomonas zehnderi OL-4]|uniref:DNA/RNA tunnel of bacterial DNA dependent RNA polymerase n=1 Tax=Syntrophomonas zehnderi OL-4 TaxID=690567 RepID=A0A0E4C7P7_9FIRM|nr:NAD(+)--rifampin ADP-ribosyltransferase [Syntrophomonas zehnderi]CFX06541.1 DNA/RNA tunnel of bacterial DNA dependent RNA polymerase [Syntrophomonas zehnderi OL-4]CFX33174.1 DNA/RNA tunnel of bacterial DNA dependent RNA polymerase [Syntrophomonas zehnderi OL-4]